MFWLNVNTLPHKNSDIDFFSTGQDAANPAGDAGYGGNDDVDNLAGILGGMNMGRTATGRPKHLPPTTQSLMMIPLVPFDIPESSRQGINIELVLPSGVTEDMVEFRVVHEGWTGQFRIDFHDFMTQEDRYRYQENAAIGNAEANAFQAGVRQLRSVQTDRVFISYVIALPIQVEQAVSRDQVEYLARPNPKQTGQFICYSKVRLVSKPLGHMSAASPARVRFVNPTGQTGYGNVPFGHQQQPQQPFGGMPFNYQQPNPPAQPAQPPQPPPQPAAQPQPAPVAPGSGGGGPNNLGNADDIRLWLQRQSDTELQVNLDNLYAFVQRNQGQFTTDETNQINTFIQEFNDEIQRRMQSANGWNP